MKTPTFWNQKNLLSDILIPFGWLYSGLTRLRLKLHHPYKSKLPVICIGNLTAGGSGKTPTAIALAQILQKEGYCPYFLSRGYGGKYQNIIVNKQNYQAEECGDEPLLLSETAPVVINADRGKGARLAEAARADILIMDDGFQNPTLHKDISFIVIDGGFGFGNFRAIPSGPLRETFSQGIKRAQAAIIIGEDKTSIKKHLGELPTFSGKIIPLPIAQQEKGIIAFAGIGRPQKFYESLKQAGGKVIETYDFPDHHPYTTQDTQELEKRAKELDAFLYTTSKDYVKLPKEFQKKVEVLSIKIDWEDETSLRNFIIQQLSAHIKQK